ncbi:hypothetical protein ACW9HQ_46860, partial [Nocardia gipuzkoensis]
MTQAVDWGADAAVRVEAHRLRRIRYRDNVLAVLVPLLALSAWQWAAQVNLIDARMFPPPSRILARAAAMAASGELLRDVAATSVRLFGGFVP